MGPALSKGKLSGWGRVPGREAAIPVFAEGGCQQDAVREARRQGPQAAEQAKTQSATGRREQVKGEKRAARVRRGKL